jgi:hypothetical protein
MSKNNIKLASLAAATLAFGTLASINWSPGENPSLAVESGQAICASQDSAIRMA